MDFVTLTCPSCGGKLQITNDIDRFACAHCGTEHVIKRSGGIVTLAPVVAVLKDVRTGVDKTASELALPRLQAELEALHAERANRAGAAIPNYSFGTCLGWIVLGVIAAALVVAIAGIESEVGWIVALIVGPAVLFGAYTLGARSRRDAQRREEPKLREDLAALDEQIRRKEEEIAKHRQILSR